jgi:hypothetical protein
MGKILAHEARQLKQGKGVKIPDHFGLSANPARR